MARFANEFGTGVPSHVSHGVDDWSEGNDNAEEERGDIVNNMGTISVSSPPPLDGLPVHHDRPISREVCSVIFICVYSEIG